MRPMETERLEKSHDIFRDDGMREQDGLRDEVVPPEKAAMPLEARIIGQRGRLAEEEMQMLLTGGSM